MKSLGGRLCHGQSIYRPYVAGLEGDRNPLKELIKLKKKNNLETYIKDFDIL
jgi:uncharacterized lipoprotein YddW (UPF0748 family)